MRSAFAKDALRTVRGTLRRFLSIAAICVLGVTMLVGLTIACEDLRLSADEFFDAQRLYDVSVQSTLGLTADDVTALRALDGVEAAEGSWAETAYTEVEGARQQVSVRALMASGMNEPHVTQGRLPEAASEVAVTVEYLEDTGKSLGDAVTFGVEAGSEGADGEAQPGDATEDAASQDASDDADASAAEQFAQHPYTIVGVVIDPTSVAARNGSSSFRATGARYSFFVPASAATAEAYSVAYLRVAGAAATSGFSAEYEGLVARVTNEAEAIKAEREQARAQELRDEANAKVDDAEREVEDGLASAESQLADAQRTIDDALAQVASGREELADKQGDAESQLDAAQRGIDDGRAQLEEASAQLDANEAQLDAAEDKLPGGQAELDAARGQLAAAKASGLAEAERKVAEGWWDGRERAGLVAQRDELKRQLAKLEAQLAQAQGQAQGQAATAGLAELEGQGKAPAAAPEAQLAQAQGQAATAGLAELEQAIAQARAGISALDDGIAKGDAKADEQLAAAKAEVERATSEQGAKLDQWQAGLTQLADGRSRLAAARQQLDLRTSQLEAGQRELDEQRAAAQAGLDEGARQLDDAERQAQDGQAELDERRAGYEREKADALAKIDEARAKANDIQDATWYVQDRSAISSYASIESDASSIEVIGTVFPAIFLTVAVLVSLTTATRMVEEERGLVGLYKALGYGRGAIMAKYVLYAVAAAALGGVVGAVLGFVALPEFLFGVFEVMYELPAFTLHFDAGLCALAVGMFVVGIGAATALTVRGELAEQPAALMRPRAPRPGTRILLERIGPLWRRMSFLNKVTARNLFRYKRRLAMTVFGVAGCCALMICGFAIADTVLALSPNQYGGDGRAGVYAYDLLAVTKPVDLPEAARTLASSPEVTGLQAIRTENVTLEHEGRKETVQLVVVPDGMSLAGYVNLRDERGEALDLQAATAGADGVPGTADDGVLATKNASMVLGFGAGDELSLQDMALRQARVEAAGVVMNYLGNAVYMTQSTYERAFGVPLEANAALVNLSGDADAQIAFAERLASDPTFLSVTSVQEGVRDFTSNFALINYVVLLITALAAGLSFVVLFTLSTTNISEREREPATIKVLGFRRGEVRRYVNKELLVLAALGTLAGVPLGTLLGHALTYALNMPSMYFAVEIRPMSYVFSCGLSMLFAVAVCLIANRSLDRVDMVGALKSAE